MWLESLHCSLHLPSPFFFFNQGLQVVLMSEVALMQLDVLPTTLGDDLALYFHGISFPVASWSRIPMSVKGEIILGHTIDFGVFTAYPWHHELIWSSLPPNPFTCWHQWEMTQWPTQKGLMGWEHSPSLAQWALPCCQSTEEPSPRKGASCWM